MKNLETMNDKKTRFKDLSWPLKIGIIAGWGIGIIYLLSVLIGFIMGAVEVAGGL